MKTAKKRAGTSTISTHEIRFQFGRVLRAVKADGDFLPDDPFYRLHELAPRAQEPRPSCHY